MKLNIYVWHSVTYPVTLLSELWEWSVSFAIQHDNLFSYFQNMLRNNIRCFYWFPSQGCSTFPALRSDMFGTMPFSRRNCSKCCAHSYHPRNYEDGTRYFRRLRNAFSSVAQFFLIEILVFWYFDLKPFAVFRQRIVLVEITFSFFNFASRRRRNAILSPKFFVPKNFLSPKVS